MEVSGPIATMAEYRFQCRISELERPAVSNVQTPSGIGLAYPKFPLGATEVKGPDCDDSIRRHFDQINALIGASISSAVSFGKVSTKF